MNDTKTKSKSPAQPKAEGAGPSAIPLEDYSDSSEDEVLHHLIVYCLRHFFTREVYA
jgi:hypothetical protein